MSNCGCEFTEPDVTQDPVPSCSFAVLKRNVFDVDRYANGDVTFENRTGTELTPLPLWDEFFQAALDALAFELQPLKEGPVNVSSLSGGVFNFAEIQYVPGENQIFVFANGSKLELDADYTESSATSITLTASYLAEADGNDRIEVWTNDLLPNNQIKASGVSFNDTVTQLGAATVQSAIEKLQGEIQEGSPEREVSFPFQIADGIVSWWAAPMFLNNGRYSYIAHSQGQGQIVLTVIDNRDRTTKTHRIDVDNFTADDHNTGSVIAGNGRVMAFWPGRTRKEGTGSNFAFYYVEFAEGTDPMDAQLVEIDQSRDYPATYQIGDQFLLFGRNSNQASEPQYTARLQGWPFNGFGPKFDFLETDETWPYIASRRSALDKNKINIAVGFHPTNNPFGNVYVGSIERSGGVGSWLLRSDGSTVANISTGSGLPFTHTDLELAYESDVNERVRLLNIADDCILIVSYEEASPQDGIYKVVRKVNGSWQSEEIAPTGAPFEENAGVQYFGGASFSSDTNKVYLTRESGGLWIYEEYETTDGLNYTLKEQMRSRGPDGMSVVVGRPTFEEFSYSAWTEDNSETERAVVFAGRYNAISFTDFNTELVSTCYLKNSWQPVATKSNGATIASEGSLARNHRTAAIASRAVFLNSRISGTLATQTTTISGERSAAVASTGSTVSGATSGIIGSNNCTVSGTISTAAGSTLCTVGGQNSVAVGSNNCTASANNAAVYSSSFSSSAHGRSVILAGRSVATAGIRRVAGGYGTGTTPTTANRKWEFDSNSGDLRIAGTLTQNNTFADIAKMMINGEGVVIEPGTLLTLIGDKVYKAKEGEHVDAIVAATPAIIQNDTPFAWQGRYLRDEWGRIIYHNVEFARWVNDEGVTIEVLVSELDAVPEHAEIYTESVPMENPDYDDTAESVSRSERPDEWTLAGVHGIIRTRVDTEVTQAYLDGENQDRKNVYLKVSSVDGIATLSNEPTNMQLMRVEHEFDEAKGYGIAGVLLR